MDLGKNVRVYSDNPILAKWDGNQYRLGKDPVEVKLGVALHWQERHRGIRIEDIPPEVIEQRIPQNPLEDAGRGEAFPELKKKKRKS